MTNKITVSLRLDKDTHVSLKELASRELRSISATAELLLLTAMGTTDKKKTKTRKPKAEAEELIRYGDKCKVRKKWLDEKYVEFGAAFMNETLAELDIINANRKVPLKNFEMGWAQYNKNKWFSAQKTEEQKISGKYKTRHERNMEVLAPFLGEEGDDKGSDSKTFETAFSRI